MPRSRTVTIQLPHPLYDGLEDQITDGVIDYRNVPSSIKGLILYQLLHGKEHALTSPIMHLHDERQDVVFDFAYELNRRGLNAVGSFLRRVAERVAAGEEEPNPAAIERMQATQILDWALRWQRGDESVWAEIETRHDD